MPSPSTLRLLQYAAATLALSLVVSCNMIKPKAKKPFGQPCESPFDCESTNCNRERGGFCSKACAADAECGEGYVCAGQPTGTGGSCAKKQGNPTGTACRDRDECDHGTCLKKTGEQTGFCSQRCKTYMDCPTGYQICDKISDMGAQKLCLPGDAPGGPAKAPVKAPAKN